ncbi:ABC transporter permease [Sporichthya polymorpha]|uniref:ABC transporter permease n=1 Tax=Sporichthya polymorpha TaxID=35751 RepID=UPI00037F1F6B|nr:ABC transporter permease [Sporichthya polymorpha]
MSAAPFIRRFLADYARNPVNLVVLVVVPVIFVVVAAGSMANAARVLTGSSGSGVQTASAGWAAAFLAGVAMYFQTRAARSADRRLVLAGLAPAKLVAARAGTGLILALGAATAALLALAARTGIEDPGRVIAGTVMFAVIYLAVGALVGVLVANPTNAMVTILFIWLLDVVFGPAMGSPDRVATRWFPTHFVTLWMIDLPSRHGGRPGDLGWALGVTLAAVAIAWAVLAATTRRARPAPRPTGQMGTALRMGLIGYRRNPVLGILLVIVPVVFILLAKATTQPGPFTLPLAEDGKTVQYTFWLPDVHAGTMVPIALGALSALAGLFVLTDARAGDRRLVLAGFRARTLLTARLGTLAMAVLLITVAALAVTALVFDPRQWPGFIAASVLVAATYGLVGVVLGAIFGRVAGVFIAFLVPFLDLGLGQSPMLRPEPEPWASVLPGYGASRVLLDTGLTNHFDQTGPLLAALAWLVGLALTATALFHRSMPTAPARPGEPGSETRGRAAGDGSRQTDPDDSSTPMTHARIPGAPRPDERRAPVSSR